MGFLAGEKIAEGSIAKITSSPGKLPRLAKFFSGQVVGSCAKLVGGIVVAIVAEQLIGALMSYFKGEELKKKLTEMN